MKKWIKWLSLTSVVPICCVTSCGPVCEHEKGQLIDINISQIGQIKRPGIFKCQKCGSQYIDEILPNDINMPMINLVGDIQSMPYDVKRNIKVEYLSLNSSENFNVAATIKIQGGSSKFYPKKNYTIQLFQEIGGEKYSVQFKDWPKMSKYILKADWVDCRHIRTFGLSQVWEQMIHFRPKEGAQDFLYDATNCGTPDAFPLLVFNNNHFLGLYQICCPKSKYLVNMKEDSGSQSIHQALFFSGGQTHPSSQLKGPIEKDKSLEEQGWDIEFNSIDDDGEWIIDSMNALINFINNTIDDNTFKVGITQYIDLVRTIDFMCFNDMFYCKDNRCNNINWCTYDGQTWTPVMWDLDESFGYDWGGHRGSFPFNEETDWTINALFNRIRRVFSDQYLSQFHELRQAVFQPSNIITTLLNFYLQTNPIAFKGDFNKWKNIPDQDDGFLYYLNDYHTKRWQWLESREN